MIIVAAAAVLALSVAADVVAATMVTLLVLPWWRWVV
jgi:hypothetical protein